jgi:hypothetical protein
MSGIEQFLFQPAPMWLVLVALFYGIAAGYFPRSRPKTGRRATVPRPATPTPTAQGQPIEG